MHLLASRVDSQDGDIDRFVHREVVDADDHALLRFDLALVAVRSLGDFALLRSRSRSAGITPP